MLIQDSEDEIRSRFVFELAIWLWQDELNPRVRCAFGNVFFRFRFQESLSLNMLLTSLPYSSHSKNLKSKEKIENTNIRGCMDLRAAPDIFNMFESTDRERSSWAGLRDIAIYLPSLSPPILSLREKKLFGWILIFFLRTQSRCFLYFMTHIM